MHVYIDKSMDILRYFAQVKVTRYSFHLLLYYSLMPFLNAVQVKRELPLLLAGASSGLFSLDLFLLGLEHTLCTNTG